MDPIILTAPRIFLDKFLFIVQIAGVRHSGYNKCSELKGEVAVIEYSEGGAMTPDKSPGRSTWPPVTLERGMSTDNDLLEWWEEIIDIASVGPTGEPGRGAPDPSFRRDVDIISMSRTKNPIQAHRLFRAWPMSFVYGEWDADADEKTIIKIELAHQGIVRIPILI